MHRVSRVHSTKEITGIDNTEMWHRPQVLGKVGLTEAMMSKVLNGSRILMPWHYDNFAKVLGITKGELVETIDTDTEGLNDR